MAKANGTWTVNTLANFWNEVSLLIQHLYLPYGISLLLLFAALHSQQVLNKIIKARGFPIALDCGDIWVVVLNAVLVTQWQTTMETRWEGCTDWLGAVQCSCTHDIDDAFELIWSARSSTPTSISTRSLSVKTATCTNMEGTSKMTAANHDSTLTLQSICNRLLQTDKINNFAVERVQLFKGWF